MSDSEARRTTLRALQEALGRVVFSFGALDHALHDAIWMACDMQQHVRVLTAGLRFPELVDRFRVLYADFRDDLTSAQGVKETCNALLKANEERNRQIHSGWGLWSESDTPARQRTKLDRSGLNVRIESVTVEELVALSERMDQLEEKVWEIALDFDRQQSARKGKRGGGFSLEA